MFRVLIVVLSGFAFLAQLGAQVTSATILGTVTDSSGAVVAKKAFIFSEARRLEFRAEFFNVLNHTNFSAPGNTLGSPNFGVIAGSEPARVSQMSLKLVF